MDRRTLLQSAVAATAAAALPGAALAQRDFDPQPGAWRTYEVTTKVEMLRPAGVSRVWIPLPSVNEAEWVRCQGDQWTGNAQGTAIRSDGKYGARMLAAEWAPGSKAPVLSVTSRVATRDRATDFSRRDPARTLEPAMRRFYTAATELLPTDGIVLSTAQKITRGAHTDIAKARAIYDWVCNETYREPSTRGCGAGDIKAMLESGNLGGKCADLNALYVGLARAAGLPARDVYGLRVAPSAFGYKSLGANSPNVTRAQHCRAEVWLAGLGWVPVDPADVRKFMLSEPPGNLPADAPRVVQVRERLFGAWETNWLPYNVAHDLSLPGSKGVPIGFLMYPQGETSAERFDSLDPANFRYTISAKTLDS